MIELGRREEALSATSEAVEIYRQKSVESAAVSRLSAGLFVEYLGPTERGPEVTTVGAGCAVPTG